MVDATCFNADEHVPGRVQRPQWERMSSPTVVRKVRWDEHPDRPALVLTIRSESRTVRPKVCPLTPPSSGWPEPFLLSVPAPSANFPPSAVGRRDARARPELGRPAPPTV